MIRFSFFSVYKNTISYIKGLSPAPSWRLGLFFEGADWAMAQQNEIRGIYWVRLGQEIVFVKNTAEGQNFAKYKTKKMHILYTRLF